MPREYMYKGDTLWENGTIVSEPDVFHKLYTLASENPNVSVFKLTENVVEHFKILLFSGQLWEMRKTIFKIRKTNSECPEKSRTESQHHEKNL